jgi:hypothetical protein
MRRPRLVKEKPRNTLSSSTMVMRAAPDSPRVQAATRSRAPSHRAMAALFLDIKSMRQLCTGTEEARTA